MAKAQSNWKERVGAFWLSIVACSHMCGEEFELLDRINRFSMASGDNWHCGLRLSDDV
jgi:hypothetical protein